MKFGAVEDISGIEFKLPEDPDFTSQTIRGLSPSTTKVLIGCSVWSEKSYVGHIYPPGTKPANYLTEYAKQFNSIEVNATRYGIPKQATLDKWRDSVPTNFKFCFKLPQIISFAREINGQPAQERMDKFISSVYGFGARMGTSFAVFPKHFGNDRFDDLTSFVNSLPIDLPLAFEFRNNEIIKNAKMWELMKTHNKPIVITDTPGEREFVHQLITNNQVFIRFVGNKLHQTDYSRIDEWVDKLIEWMASGLTEVAFFIHQPAPHKHLSADLAIYMIDKLNTKKPELNLSAPVIYNLQF